MCWFLHFTWIAGFILGLLALGLLVYYLVTLP